MRSESRPTRSAIAIAIGLSAAAAGCERPNLYGREYDSGVVIADAYYPLGFPSHGHNDGGMADEDGAVGADHGPWVRPSIPELDPIATAAQGTLRFKGGRVLQADLAASLELSASALATELGTTDAFRMHQIALLGTDPYGSGILLPTENTSVTGPMVVDRIVLSACRVRVDRDLATPAQGVLFRNLPIDSHGGLSNLAAPEVGQAIERIYQRFLKRDPQPHEREILTNFYAAALAKQEAQPARAWAIMACFMVGSSTENLFY
ncbi:MAG: hypothetical protein U1E65_19070 [Myxococcota bacterium]